MKRILHIQKVKYIAGSENHLLTLLPRLREYGYEPTMLVLADSEDRPEAFCKQMQASGVLTEVMSMRGDADPMLLWKLTRYIFQHDFDLIHTHLLHADLYGRIAAQIVGITTLSSYHCDDPFHLIPGIRLLDYLTGRICCSQVICISHHVRDFVARRIRLPIAKLHTVHYGFAPLNETSRSFSIRSALHLPLDVPLLGNVGRLTEQKGQTYLLDAMKLVLDSYPSAHLVIAGDGELRAILESQTRRLGITANVHFLGHYPDAALLMDEFDILVHSALFEGFGMVFLEAMSAAKPVITTNVSAIPEIVVDGETGLLVPPKDSVLLAQAICKLLNHPKLAVEMGKHGRQRLENEFTVEKMLEQTVQIYSSCFNIK